MTGEHMDLYKEAGESMLLAPDPIRGTSQTRERDELRKELAASWAEKEK